MSWLEDGLKKYSKKELIEFIKKRETSAQKRRENFNDLNYKYHQTMAENKKLTEKLSITTEMLNLKKELYALTKEALDSYREKEKAQKEINND